MSLIRTRYDWAILELLAPTIISYSRIDKMRWNVHQPQGCIVEIGAGDTTQILSDVAVLTGAKHYTVDVNSVKKFHANHVVYKGRSDTFIEGFNDAPVLVVLDGEHYYDNVKREFYFFLDKLVDSGMIFIHDTFPYKEKLVLTHGCSDAYRLRQEIEKNENLQVFTWPYTANNCGLTMVMKKEKNQPYYRQ